MPDWDEEDPERGPGIRLNTDHDNGDDDLEDRNVTGSIAAENDLIRVDVQLATADQQLVIQADDPLVLWFDPKKASGSIVDGADVGGVWQSDVLDFANGPGDGTELTVWVEWVGGFHGNADIRLIDIAAPAAQQLQDTVEFHSFETLVIGISGETFNGTIGGLFGTNEPTDQATDGIAVDLIGRGFDAQYFDNQTINFGHGAPYDVAVNAIENRSVNFLGIFGYSHGGGKTYDLSRELNTFGWIGPEGEAALAASAYIDAVSTSSVPIISGTYNPFAQEHRPVSSQHHGNWYQRNGVLDGGSVPGSMPNHDLSNMLFDGEQMSHNLIDDFVEDRDFVEEFMTNHLPSR